MEVRGQYTCEFRRRSKTSTHVLSGNRLLVGCPQGLDGVGVVSQIVLAADQDDGETGAEVHDLRDPLSKTQTR